MQVPFVKRAPLVTFQKPIGSVSVSGHKFVGAPVPCGVVITRTRYVEALANSIEYLNSRDATIMGSRNGHAPIYLWYTLTRKGYEGMRQDVERCLLNAHLLKVRIYLASATTRPATSCLTSRQSGAYESINDSLTGFYSVFTRGWLRIWFKSESLRKPNLTSRAMVGNLRLIIRAKHSNFQP